MSEDITRRFARVRARPDSERARQDAADVLAELEAAHEPSPEALAIVCDDAFVWVGLGLARRLKALVERWRRGGARDAALGRAEAIYTVAIAPPAAAGRLRALAGDRVASAVSVANHVFRGELRAAVERCRSDGWYLDEPEAITGVAYGTWALAMLDEFDDALAVIGMWRHQHPQPTPVIDQALLAAEARIESVRHHHVRERALLEEALAVCEEHDLGLQRAYLEASHVIALARAGDMTAAARLEKRWNARKQDRASGSSQPDTPSRPGALEVYRDVARAELALLAGRYRDADAAARRVLAYSEANGNAIYTCVARHWLALAATRSTLRALVDDYGRIAAQLQIPVHLRRHRLLARLAAAGIAPRDRQLTARRRGAQTALPVLRTCFPSIAEVNADLYWDRVQDILYLGGDGPFHLDEHPILRRVLEAIVSTRAFSITISELFERVWEMPYRPLVHEGKCHVALHRLRKLLDGWRRGAETAIEVRDGSVRIADTCSAVVLELNAIAVPTDESLGDRILAYVAACGESPTGDIAARVGGSRTSVQRALRTLVATKQLARAGRGRATTYAKTARRDRARRRRPDGPRAAIRCPTPRRDR